MKQIGQPERQTVDQPCAAAVCFDQRLHQIERHLPLDPAISASHTVRGDALGHFIIKRLGGCDIDWPSRNGARTNLCMPTLSRPRSPSYQDDRHDYLPFPITTNRSQRQSRIEANGLASVDRLRASEGTEPGGFEWALLEPWWWR